MKLKQMMKIAAVAAVLALYGLTALGCDDSSSSDDYDYDYDYKSTTAGKSDDYDKALEDFTKDVDKAGDGDGKADWDDWNDYADANGYDRAY